MVELAGWVAIGTGGMRPAVVSRTAGMHGEYTLRSMEGALAERVPGM
jgi:hypothetical protein